MKTIAYLLDISELNDAYYQKGLSLIDNNRKNKLTALSNIKLKKQSLGVELLLIYALKKQNIPYHGISYTSTGMPILNNYPNIYISLSHSGDFCACVLSDAPVAIDIQKLKGLMPNIIKRYFTADEQMYLTQQTFENTESAFYNIWCRKECLVKYYQNWNLELLDTQNYDNSHIFYDYFFSDYALSLYMNKDSCVSSIRKVTLERIINELISS